jgi:hypothetical protein
MIQLNKNKYGLIVTVCCAVLCFYALHAHAAQSSTAITPELLQRV